MKKRLWLALSLFVVGALVLAACRPATPPPPTFSGTVTITFVQEPDNLNPLYTEMWFSQITREFWLKGLWSFDADSQPVPELAAEIPSAANGGLSADGKTLTVKLRPDAVWSDGTALTADDFVFTYNMIMAEGNIVQSRYPYEDYVASVEAKDKNTLVVNFKEPLAAWLTTIFTYVLPKHVLQPAFDKDGSLDNAEWNRKPTAGAGPFAFSEWESGSHIIFVANPKWHRVPKLEKVFVRIVPDDAAQEAAILAGDTDIGVFLDSSQIETLEAGGTLDVVGTPGGFNEAWFLNVNPATTHPAMLDVNVRKAIALATDRFTIVKDLLDPGINPVNVTFWDNTPLYATESLQPYTYDPEEAKKLLDEAGWKDTNGDGIRDKDGVELKLRYITNDRQLRVDVQAVVQQQWAALGIAAELVNHSSDIYWNSYNDGGPQAQGLYEVAEYSSSPDGPPDPEASANWLCEEISSAENPDGINWQGYCNPALDELLQQQAVTTDPNKRIEIYRQIQQIMYDEVIYIGMWKDPDLWSINKRLQNVRLSGPTPFSNAHEWTVSP
jgi:peptide/nickel transport system substrate-binding protein